MNVVNFTSDKISISYKGASVFATGRLAKIITYSFAALAILIAIAATQNLRSSK